MVGDYFQRSRASALHLVEATAMGLDIPAIALLNRCLPYSSSARLKDADIGIAPKRCSFYFF